MITLLFTLALIPLLSHDEYSVRESAEAGLLALGEWYTVDHAMKTTACPEAKNRLHRVRGVLTIRELDRLAGGCFPRSYRDLRWPIAPVTRYSTPGPVEITTLVLLGWPEEFQDERERANEDERDTTRRQLLLYVSRTGDWETVRRILK